MDTMKRILAVLLVAVAATAIWFLGLSDSGVGLAKEAAQTDLGPPHILQCYALKEGDVHDKPALLETRNFGGDVVRITQAITMCEEAIKT